MVEHDFDTMPFLQHPSVDVVTGRDPQPGERVVDTRFNLALDEWHPRNGRIYLSESTVRDAAEALGYKLVKEKK